MFSIRFCDETDVFHFTNRCFTLCERVFLIVEYVSLCINLFHSALTVVSLYMKCSKKAKFYFKL